MNESPSLFARLRAGISGALGRLAAGAHRLEDWSARGTRPVLLSLAVLTLVVVGAFAMLHESRAAAQWLGGGPRHERGLPPGPRAESKPVGKPEAKPAAKPEERRAGRQEGGPAGRPEGGPAGRQEDRSAGRQEGRGPGRQEGRSGRPDPPAVPGQQQPAGRPS